VRQDVALAEEVTAKLGALPTSPGCYLFLDAAGAVLYVGKAKVLRSRVRSYFQEGGSDARYFIPLLRDLVADIDTVVTSTEKEAAVLENELIKRNRPRFNVKLRDDKDFLCLRLDAEQTEWPRLETVRRPDPGRGAVLRALPLGHQRAPHPAPRQQALSAADLLRRRFRLAASGPCLQYQIKRCPAPCVLEVDPEAVRSAWSAR
jgi:excinuclease ABC subunit C